jgi:hypothetical protein
VYDVFINHRGSDVKNTLASHIYYRLKEQGLRVFLDKHELQKGVKVKPQIEEAIQTAPLHIAVLSPRYAESSWCLNELVLMLESRKRILPVFYGVKPSDLRRTRGGDGVYARSLDVLEKKRTWDSQPLYDSNTIKKWRDALSEVADISGFELKACNGDEGELVDKVVQSVKTHFSGVRRLDFSGRSTLQALPDSGLQSLHLGLSGRSTLQALPDSGLQSLHLGLHSLHLGLQSLHLGSCSTLQALPKSIRILSRLKSVYPRWSSTVYPRWRSILKPPLLSLFEKCKRSQTRWGT